MLTWPFSSDTTTTTASVCSVIPRAARWRVPKRSVWTVISASGRSAPAARSISSRMMIAPSWSGAFGAKIVRIRSADTSAWIMTPVSATSSSPVSRSRTISAPWPSADICAAAWATSSATCSTARRSAGEKSQLNDPTRPMRSSARRSSGWKTTTRANSPTTAPACRICVSSWSWKKRAAAYTANRTVTPMTKLTARVPRIRLKSQ